jgi:Fic family protein
MEISVTARDADELDRKKIKDAMYSANSQMLSVLSEGRELSVADISHWNYEIFKGSSDEEVALPAGIIRGDSESKDVMNPLSDTRERVRVDISGANAAGGTLKSGPEFWYTDAARVPSEMKALVQEVNKIGRQTSLEEIVGVYRNFIIIHPFVDGNGRTGRVLFDYMLLKAGFPSLPSNPTLRNVFYRTESELNNQLINSYIAE